MILHVISIWDCVPDAKYVTNYSYVVVAKTMEEATEKAKAVHIQEFGNSGQLTFDKDHCFEAICAIGSDDLVYDINLIPRIERKPGGIVHE